MAKDSIVRSSADNREYLLGDFLQAGLIGAVYPGLARDGSGRKVAVKLPARNLSFEQQRRFRQESETLTQLARQFPRPPIPVPAIEDGQVVGTGQEALILEFVGEDRLLTTRLPEDDWQRELLLLRAGAQYARLLEGLHAINLTCQDRKLTDLRWLDQDGGRLVVLDWNVVEQGPAKRVDDLLLFARLWYQMLAGRYPSGNVNPMDDGLWRGGGVSFGTRRLFAQMLSPQADRRLQTAGAVRQALENRLAWVSAPVPVVSGRERQVFQQLQLAQRQPNALPDLSQEWGLLDRFDVAFRRGEEGPAEREMLLGWVSGQGERLLGGVAQAFRLGQYDRGEQVAQEVEAIVSEQGDPWLRLGLLRWLALLASGREAIGEANEYMGTPQSRRLEMRDVRNPLADWVAQVESAGREADASKWQSWVAQLEQLSQERLLPGSRTVRLLDDLLHEGRLQSAWASIRQAEFAGKYDVALIALTELEGHFGLLSQRFKEGVRGVLPNLASWAHVLTEKQRESAKLAVWAGELDKHFAFLKEVRVPDMAEGGSPGRVQSTLSLFTQLNELHMAREAVYTSYDKEGVWLRVVRLAYPLWHNRERDERVRWFAGECLREAREMADRRADSKSTRDHQFSQAIYNELKNLRARGSR